jgi:hypothetical protein
LTLLVRPQIKNQVDGAAKENGVTQAQEGERRIENSFRDENVLDGALDLAFGDDVAALLLLLGKTVRVAADATGFFAPAGRGRWLEDPYTFDHVVRAVAEVLETLRPKGEIVPPVLHSGGDAFALIAGEIMARGVLDELPPVEGGQPHAWVIKIRVRFGDPVLERIRQRRRQKYDELMRQQLDPT